MGQGFTRREFLGYASTASLGWYLSQYSELAWAAPPSGGFFDKSGPIHRGLPDVAPAEFFGDEFERSHRLLWDIPAYLKTQKFPTEWEKTELAVIGGGLSGLFTSYLFRKVKPIVLEQASRFGGNAKGQSWRGTDFGLGSAYFPKPEKGSAFYRFYQELGLENLVQRAPETEPVAVDGVFSLKFWNGEKEPAHAATYDKLGKFLKNIYDAKTQPYPEIPPSNPAAWKVLEQGDSISLQAALEKAVGPLPPLLKRAIEAYCWSSFAASSTEVNAAAGLSFLASESSPVCVAPGGNAGVAEQALKSCLGAGVPASHFRTGCVVVQVRIRGERVQIVYEDADGKLKGIDAKAAVLACPKYVAAKIVEGIEPERLSAIGEIEYRSYVSAAVLIGKPLRTRFYDAFIVDTNQEANTPRITDIAVGSLGQTRGRNTALTLYRAMPSPSARATLMGKDAYATLRTEFQKQIESELLPLLGFAKKDLVDLRIARWGHALPVPKIGVFSKGLPQALRKPFGTRVFFIEQDNWLTPALETGAGEAVLQEPLIASALGLVR